MDTGDSLANFEKQQLQQQEQYELLLSNVKKIEGEIVPQLEMLSVKLPEIYKEYATIVRTTIGKAIEILNVKGKGSKNALRLAAELAARAFEVFGAWKAARDHNKMLDKFIATKREIASLNLEKMENARKQADHNLEAVKKLFLTYAKQEYDFTDKDNELIVRQSELLLRNLALYRTNLFISKICAYLDAEYHAWSIGEQTSGKERPDYFAVNKEVMHELFPSDPFTALEMAGEAGTRLSGEQLLLLSDPQLSVFALKDNMCHINFHHASNPVKVLAEHNPGFDFYNRKMQPLIRKMKENPAIVILILAILAIGGIACLCVFYLPCIWWGRLIIGVLAGGIVTRMAFRYALKARHAHVTETMEMANKVEYEVAAFCGKVEAPHIDYQPKNALQESLKAFLE